MLEKIKDSNLSFNLKFLERSLFYKMTMQFYNKNFNRRLHIKNHVDLKRVILIFFIKSKPKE